MLCEEGEEGRCPDEDALSGVFFVSCCTLVEQATERKYAVDRYHMISLTLDGFSKHYYPSAERVVWQKRRRWSRFVEGFPKTRLLDWGILFIVE